jgi:hypothetical protein
LCSLKKALKMSMNPKIAWRRWDALFKGKKHTWKKNPIFEIMLIQVLLLSHECYWNWFNCLLLLKVSTPFLLKKHQPKDPISY